MKMLKRNQQPFYYALYTGKVAVTDENGNFTGEYTETYGTKTLAYGNIGAPSGSINSQWYGLSDEYSKTIIVDKDLPIADTTRLWIDDIECSGGDYVVKQIRISLNYKSILIKKV